MRRSRQLRLHSLLVAGALALTAARTPAAAEPSHSAPESWAQGYTLVVLDSGADVAAATRWVQAQGGTIALQLPNDVLTGWIPESLDAALVGRAGIRGVYRDPAQVPAEIAARIGARRALRFFARARHGLLDAPQDDAHKSGAPFTAGPGVLLPDAFDRPPVPVLDVLANFARQGLDVRKAGGTNALLANSETMTGTISVALFFLESDGTGTDPDLHDWNADREDDVFDEAAAALSWWSAQAKKHSGCWAVFRLEPHFATEDARCRQWRELQLHPSTDFGAAVSDVLGNHGFTSGGHLARGIAYNAALRAQNGTDWAYSAFVVANPTGATAFTDGYAAWAYLGGPYLALLERSFGWDFKQVFAHESAHAFRACDEYSVAGYGGCTSCSGCADTGVANGNCEACNPDPDPCMMRSNTFALCSYTTGQLGWGRAPCVPEALPPPRLDAVAPATVAQATELDLDLTGAGFTFGSSVDCGAGVQTIAVTLVSDQSLRIRIRVGAETQAGARDVTVSGPDGQASVLAQALLVYATPRHYVSAAGAGTFPYDRPERAAASLAQVLEACSAGDTVLVATGTYAPIAIHKTLVILGGWMPDFALRTPETFASILQGVPGLPAVQVDGAGTTAVLDGFVVRGGAGSAVFTPQLGTVPAGGGIFCYDAAPVFRACTIENNTAGTAGAPGAGGGVFCWRGRPTFERCIVRGNSAARGAGFLFLESDATLIDTVVEDNDAGGAGKGGGIAVLEGRLTIRGGRVAGNHGAQDGGGLHADHVTLLELHRTTFDVNAAGHDGGGLHATASAVRATATRFTRNTAGYDGGAARMQDGSLALESCVVAANTATHGAGGIQARDTGGVLCNLTLADNTGGVGGGIVWAGLSATLALRSSILYRNSQGALLYSGGTPAQLDWNLAFENGAFDWAGALPGAHDLPAADPRFTNSASHDYRLALAAPGLDRGDSDPGRNDPDGSRNDVGAHGGPLAWPAAPPRVTGLRAREHTAHVWVQWNPSTDPGVASYVVYRTAGAAPDLGATPLATLPAATTVFDDLSPIPDAWYAVVAVDAAGHASGAAAVPAGVQTTDVTTPPAALALSSVAPNPVNPGAWIEFDLPPDALADLDVFNVRGAPVRRLAGALRGPGPKRVYWDGRDRKGVPVASGVYWVALTAGGERRTRRVVVVR